MTSFRHPPLTESQKREVRELWEGGNGLMSIASTLCLPSGTLKPFIDTLSKTQTRKRRVEMKRSNPLKYWPASPARLTEDEIAALYRRVQYDNICEAGERQPEPRVKSLAETIEAAGAVLGIEIKESAQSGLWDMGKITGVPIRRAIKLLNDSLRRRGLEPIADPDDNNGQVSRSSRRLSDGALLGM